MRSLRYFAIATFLVGLGVLHLAAAERARTAPKLNAPATRGQVTIVKAKLDPNVITAITTGVQGTIQVEGGLAQSLSTMQCSDITVSIGKYTTPTQAPSGTIIIPTFEEVASAAATGTIASGTCKYSVGAVPTGVQYTVLLSAHPAGVHCDVVALYEKPYEPKLTFKPGQMQTQNFVVKPNCVVVK